MKRGIMLALLLVLCLADVPGAAAAAPRDKATVLVVFINNAKTTYDEEIGQKIMLWLRGKVDGLYNVASNEQFLAQMTERGLTSSIPAERGELISLLGNNSIDYLIVAELQPFLRKERITVFTYGKDMTAGMHLKMIDVPNSNYLYNGKFLIKASDTTMDWLIGNKSVAMLALDKVLVEMGEVISVRLPLETSVKKQPL